MFLNDILYMNKFADISNEFDDRIVNPQLRYYDRYVKLLESYCKSSDTVVEVVVETEQYLRIGAN